MHSKLQRLIPVGIAFLALLTAPSLPVPGAAKLGFSGSAAAQGYVDIDYFYDELDPYGDWVWHPRYGYVWAPVAVREDWRPYTVGHWIFTNEYGWYWDSHEPFAWAVYHYGRWGYDPVYGWFWVPGDTWAPAWVSWRYSDEYVGWAPVGPSYGGYAYGLPVNYGPPVAESWVFVRPAYLTSRSIYYYALPITNINIAFLSATTVYRPEFRGNIIYNRGIPRDQVARITNRRIIVQDIYKTNQKGGRHDRGADGDHRIQVFAPAVSKDAKPARPPKRFADNPSEFKAKAKLKNTIKGSLPKGWGPSAAKVKPITEEEGPGGFKKRRPDGDVGPAEATGGPPFEGGPGKRKKQGGPGGPNAYDVPSEEATGGLPFEGGPGKRKKQGGPGQEAVKQSGAPGGPASEQGAKNKHGKPPCKQNPDLPGCKDDQ